MKMTRLMRTWVLLLPVQLSLLLSETHADTWYIGANGVDVPDCGIHPKSPCASLQFTASRINPADVILIDGSVHDVTYHLCSNNDDVIEFAQLPSRIEGINGVPRIGCYVTQDPYAMLRFHGKPLGRINRVHIRNVVLENVEVEINDIGFNVSNSVMNNVSLSTLCVDRTCPCTNLQVHIENTTFAKRKKCGDLVGCEILGDQRIACQHALVTIQRSVFLDTKFMVFTVKYGKVVVDRSEFSKVEPYETGIGGVNVTFVNGIGVLRVMRSTFRGQVHIEPILSAINLEESALRVETWAGNINSTNATVIISDSAFVANERAVSITRPFKHVRITRCRFESNHAMHAAAALRLALAYGIRVVVTDSVFQGNSAGTTSHSNVEDRFMIEREQVHLNSDQYKGVIDLVGKGGAVRVQKGDAIFVNCTFRNNTASLLGGALFVDRGSTITAVSSYFEGTDSHVHSTQGDILYSNGAVKLRNVTFKVRTAEEHVTILRHSGEHWSMEVESLWFECPVGHRMMIINTTSHRIQENVGLKRSHKLDQLSYLCQTCGENQYSLQTGSLNYTLLNNQSEYFTLLINGAEPFQSHSVDFTYSNISCMDCPYGAKCLHGIVAVPNFWGYTEGRFATFQHCPPDYCCSQTTCTGIDTCAENRVGRLCGKCREGYSEALFSSNCVPNHTCHNFYVIPLTAAMGLVYSLFLVFQSDVRNFMFAFQSFKFKSKCCNGRYYNIRFLHKRRNKVPEEEEICMTSHKTSTNGLGHHDNGLCHHDNQNCVSNTDGASDNSPDEKVSIHSSKQETDSDGDKEPRKAGAGFLIIMFYYFQDALLLHVDTVYTKTVSRFQKQLKAFLVGLFRFRLDFYQFLDDVCLYPGMQPVPKTMFKALFVPYIIFMFGVIFILYKIYKCCRLCNKCKSPKTASASKDEKGRSNCHANASQSKSFSTKLSGGFILVFLFTYQKMAVVTFTLLNCVPIGDVSVLFIDGTQTCFRDWQYIVMSYAFTCVVPFSAVLLIGPPLLRHKYISLREFFLGCLLPLPALLYWICLIFKKRKIVPKVKVQHTVETTAVLDILQGSFQDSSSAHVLGQFCWSGVLIGRRLILFLCFTFINDILIRLLCMLCVCFIILLHHIYVQPYKTKEGNLAGAVSAAALLIVGGINLLRAGFESAEYIPIGPNLLLMQIFEELENILLLWMPLAGISLLLLALVIRLILVVLAMLHCCGLIQKKEDAVDDTPIQL